MRGEGEGGGVSSNLDQCLASRLIGFRLGTTEYLAPSSEDDAPWEIWRKRELAKEKTPKTKISSLNKLLFVPSQAKRCHEPAFLLNKWTRVRRKFTYPIQNRSQQLPRPGPGSSSTWEPKMNSFNKSEMFARFNIRANRDMKQCECKVPSPVWRFNKKLTKLTQLNSTHASTHHSPFLLH